MKAPTHTVATTYRAARGLSRTAAGRRDSVNKRRRTDAAADAKLASRATAPKFSVNHLKGQRRNFDTIDRDLQ
jgi:hypothetical protein